MIRVSQQVDNDAVALDMLDSRKGPLYVFPENHILSMDMFVGDLFDSGRSCQTEVLCLFHRWMLNSLATGGKRGKERVCVLEGCVFVWAGKLCEWCV